ncbi:3-oxoacyl-[acyl-carrier-protein] synthase III C-terminal domain-containing protein [Streptomyces sp. NPDC026206]|uniref:3-oxoacyl-[acyl-carrier-protein] synthase III C-terminal domain-containing protein n=1 Tax=Streptomyces sp. NPDC026206 TaxID=3157089 RepID=UPI0033EB2809
MWTHIDAIAAYSPQQSVPVVPYLRRLGVGPQEALRYERFYGFSRVRLDPRGTLTGLLLAAAGRLGTLRGREDRVRYVLHARTVPVASPYPANPVHEVRDALGLRHATALTVSQHACASGLLAVRLAGRLLAGHGDPDGLVLLLTGEKAFTPAARLIADTAVMGESAAAVLIGRGGPHDRLLGSATRLRGDFHQSPLLPPTADPRIQQGYTGQLAGVILDAVGRAGLAPADIRLVLPHNVNRMSWPRVLRKTGIHGMARLFLDNLPETGHCFCADTFLNHHAACALGRLHPGDHYVMTSVGLGAAFSAMVFRR